MSTYSHHHEIITVGSNIYKPMALYISEEYVNRIGRGRGRGRGHGRGRAFGPIRTILFGPS